MKTGTILIILGIVLLVISVFLWLFYFIPGRKMFRRKAQELAQEYGCKG